MLKKAAGYLLVLLITVYMFFMYDFPILSGILILELLYPFLSFFYILCVVRKMKINMDRIPSMGELGKRIHARILIENLSKFWNIKYRLYTCINNQFSAASGKRKAIGKRSMTGTIEPGKRKRADFEFESTYCGNIEFHIDFIEIYDFLGIFSRKMRVDLKKSIGILPQFEPIPLEITRRTREFPADADEYSTEKSGDDPAEIYQIREYRPWDSIHDIHWKLSAKEDELMVKEHSLPLGCVVLLWLDFEDKGKSAEGFSRLLEKTASLSVSLIEEKCVHMVSWFEEKNKRIIKRKIDSEEAVYELVWRMLALEPCGDKNLMQVYYEDAFLGDHFSSIVVIDGNGDVMVNNEPQELLQL